MKPRMLDLFCCEGGAAKGYADAGFEVVGVDIAKQPRFPFEFHQADALTFPLDAFDAVHASPPCHDHTPLAAVAGTDGTGWLLAATRERLIASGLPWALENVPGAPMRADLILCGQMFGLRVYRHRWFELGGFYALNPGHPPHPHRAVTRGRKAAWDAGGIVTITGDVGTYVGPDAMGIDWMTGDGLSQAIPPAYTRYIGEHLMAAVGGRAHDLHRRYRRRRPHQPRSLT